MYLLIRVKECAGRILFRLFFRLGPPPTKERIFYIYIYDENAVFVFSYSIVWEREVICLTVPHEMVFEIVIYEQTLHVHKLGIFINPQNKLLRV